MTTTDVTKPKIVRRKVAPVGQPPYWTLTGDPMVVAAHVRSRMHAGDLTQFAPPKQVESGKVVVAVRYAPHAIPGVADQQPAVGQHDQLVRRIGMVAIAIAIIGVLVVAGFVAVWVADHLVLVLGAVILGGFGAGLVLAGRRRAEARVHGHCPGCKG